MSDGRRDLGSPEGFDSIPGQETAFISTTGGHLTELLALSQFVPHSEDSLWITFDTPQSRDMLAGRAVEFIPYIAPRDYRGVAIAFRWFMSRFRPHTHSTAVSAGAGVAIASHAAARARGMRAVYVESVARVSTTSLSARVLHAIPGVETWTQHQNRSTARQPYFGSVLDLYEAVPSVPTGGNRVFVTLGTIRPYRFDALVDSVLAAVDPQCDLIWQLGFTTRDDLPGETHVEMSSAAFQREVDRADLVISHAGVGTLLSILASGKPSVVAPRRAHRSEHVDDHQTEIAYHMASRGLTTVTEADTLSSSTLTEAMNRRPRLKRKDGSQ